MASTIQRAFNDFAHTLCDDLTKGRVTTAYYRYLAQYALKGGLDYYAIPSKDNHRLTLKEITTGVDG